MHQPRPYCLSIAGFDPCAGAGILADIKTFEQLGVYGLGVTSAITFQNDKDFKGLEWCAFETIERQIIALQKYPVQIIKIGIIESIEMLEKIIKCIDQYFDSPKIVWDPVLKTTAGFEFHKNIKLSHYLAKRISLITPNKVEYSNLEADALTEVTMLIKGGHSKNRGIDVLHIDGQGIEITGKPFNQNIDKHGTGCVLSAAIAAFLAKGNLLEEACRKAKKYTEKFILSNSTNLGYHS